MIYRHSYLTIALVLALTWIVVACGSGGESTGPSPSIPQIGATATPSPTKARFIRRADAICDATDKKQTAAFEAFSEAYPEGKIPKALEYKFVRTADLPPILTEAEELAALTPPSGDEEKISLIVEGIEKAVAEVDKDPSSILERSYGPFSKVNEMAQDYGFKVCSKAL